MVRKNNLLKFTLFFLVCAIITPVFANNDQSSSDQLFLKDTAIYTKSFMPDNDLWKEDGYLKQFVPNVTKELFDKIVQAGRDAYASDQPTINGNWDDSTVNANCMRAFGYVTINMYGGLARRPEITPEGFSLVLCHELGHAYGGLPYIRSVPLFYMSAEGQSDYYSTLTCYDQIAARVPELSKIVDTSDFIQMKCQTFANDQIAHANCIARLEGGLSLGDLLSQLKNEATPKYETPDPTVVSTTELSYPATIQCRLDTYFAGALRLPRPACWFKN
ncbi:MAG: hypothetical protein HQK49_12165 [Oligoflexia bacterium]|nr:hypothetical protein [Oligoflexia bacterium]